MDKAEIVARSDAKFDGRDFDGLPRADRHRYLARAAAGVDASEPKTLAGMIAAIYSGMDAEDRALIDKAWIEYRGSELTARMGGG